MLTLRCECSVTVDKCMPPLVVSILGVSTHTYVCPANRWPTVMLFIYCTVLLSMELVSTVETWNFCELSSVCMFAKVFSFFFFPVELIFRCTPCLWHTEMLDLLRTKVFISRWGGYCWCCFLSTVYRASHVSIVKVVQLILIALFCWKVVLRQTLVNRDTRHI